MPSFINSKALSDLLASDRPHALLDVREHGEFNAAHIHGASWLPRRRVEMDARVLAPSNGTLLVVCDDDGRRASRRGRGDGGDAGSREYAGGDRASGPSALHRSGLSPRRAF